ncbi:MAG: MAPEG family protein [Casimicrobium sp.]
MPTPTITLLTAAACALLQFALTVIVIKRRAERGVLFENGGDDTLLRRIRAHGNLVEYAPIVLILMFMLELSGFSRTALIAFGAAFVVGRLIHAFGLLLPNWRWGRQIGMIATLITISALAVFAAVVGIQSLR